MNGAQPPAEGLVPRFARPYLQAGDPTGWFEPVYAAAGEGVADVPWVDLAPNRHLTEWLERERRPAHGRAVVIGCGIGDDAGFLHDAGYETTGFDIAPTAIAWAERRFPATRFRVANLLDLPRDMLGAFDLAFESYTVQALPVSIRDAAIAGVASLLAPGGTLLVVTIGRDPRDEPGRLPWPLTRDELARFGDLGLVERRFEDYHHDAEPGHRHFRVEYTAGG